MSCDAEAEGDLTALQVVRGCVFAGDSPPSLSPLLSSAWAASIDEASHSLPKEEEEEDVEDEEEEEVVAVVVPMPPRRPQSWR